MTPGLAAHFRMLARYNRLANERLFKESRMRRIVAPSHHRPQETP